MASKLLLIAAFVASSATSDVFYGRPHSDVLIPVSPSFYYQTPKVYEPEEYGSAVISESDEVREVDSSKYYTGGSVHDGYYDGEVLKKSVHAAQQSGLKSANGVGAKHVISADSSGEHEHLSNSAVQGSQGIGGAYTEKAKEYGKLGNGSYEDYGNNGYKKGHSSSGFYKSYQNEESGKDAKFVDEEHKEGGENFGKSFGDALYDSGKEGIGKSVSGAEYDHSATNKGLVKSGVGSIGIHDVTYDKHGHQDAYNKERSLSYKESSGESGKRYLGADQSLGEYHNGHQFYRKPTFHQ